MSHGPRGRPPKVTGKGFYEVEGHRLEWRRWGFGRGRRRRERADANAEATTLVLLHEGLGCVDRWRDFPADLAAATGLEVLAYSRHGYGASSPFTQPRTARYMHHEALVVLPAVLHQAGVGRHALVGHSDGASIALIHQGCGRGTAESVVAIAPHIYVEDVAVAHIARIRDDYESSDMRDRLGKYHTDPEATFRGWNDIWLSDAFRSWNIESCLPGITCPVLALQGADDEFATMAMLDGIAAGVSGPVQTELVPDAAHIPHIDSPQATVDLVASFLHAHLPPQPPA